MMRKLAVFDIPEMKTFPGMIKKPERKLAIFDMDKTLIDCDMLDFLGEHLGVGDEMKELTERCVRNEFGLQEGMEKRLRFLKGMHEEELRTLAGQMPLMQSES